MANFAIELWHLAFLTCFAEAITLPKPAGPYEVSIAITKLTDPTRYDPWAPQKEFRSIMVSAYVPTRPSQPCRQKTTGYMPALTAAYEDIDYSIFGIPNGTFECFMFPVCQSRGQPGNGRSQAYPLIVFSPGLGNSRLIYGALAKSIASEGSVVLTIDHPYDAFVVEYPDHTVVLGANITTDAQILKALEVRTQDVQFLLNSLESPPMQKKVVSASEVHLSLENIVMYGHSLGGATVAEVMIKDTRIAGGVNLDGTFVGRTVATNPAIPTLNRPFLIMAHENKNQSTDQSWKVFWSRLSGPALELTLNGSQHGTFSDLPLLANLLGMNLNNSPNLSAVLGSLEGERVIQILTSYLASFFDYVQHGNQSPLLEGAISKYPEISVTNRKGWKG